MKPEKAHDRLCADAPPAVAGGAPKRGERLLADARYMDSRTAETVTEWVESWQSMPPEQFEKLAQQL